MPRQPGAIYEVRYYDGRDRLVLDGNYAVEIPDNHMETAKKNTDAGRKSRAFICIKVKEKIQKKYHSSPGWIDFDKLELTKLREIGTER